MYKLILIFLFSIFSTLSFCQTKRDLNIKCDKIFKYYGNQKIKATDSLITILSKDPWFKQLSPQSQRFRILRINKYKLYCIKRKTNEKYLKGWVKRAIN